MFSFFLTWFFSSFTHHLFKNMNCVLFTMHIHHLEFLALCRFVCLLSECMFVMVFSLIQEGPLLWLPWCCWLVVRTYLSSVICLHLDVISKALLLGWNSNLKAVWNVMLLSSKFQHQQMVAVRAFFFFFFFCLSSWFCSLSEHSEVGKFLSFLELFSRPSSHFMLHSLSQYPLRWPQSLILFQLELDSQFFFFSPCFSPELWPFLPEYQNVTQAS